MLSQQQPQTWNEHGSNNSQNYSEHGGGVFGQRVNIMWFFKTNKWLKDQMGLTMDNNKKDG